jgi:tagatose-1,6-bisphosphate aldolase
MDVFASDQHSSYKKLGDAFLKHTGKGREATDEDVTEICRRFAGALGGAASAALFNSLAFLSPGFRDLLGPKVMLIGRLEDTKTDEMDGGRGQIAKLYTRPEEVADKVDAFKTLVKLDPDHKESWKRNRDWLADVFQRCQKLNRALFNETLIFQRPGESKADMARRLPEAVVRMAEDFSPLGHFYKTQVPQMWVEDKGAVTRVSTPQQVRAATEAMDRVVQRPMLLLSAAVDFEQYAAQYGIVCDLVAGPMCGRAYFKEAFTDPETRDWDTLVKSFRKIALPRIALIRSLCQVMSRPWWGKFTSIDAKAKALIRPDAKPKAEGVKADFGY